MTLSCSAIKKSIAVLLMGALYAPSIYASTLPAHDDAYVLEFARKYSDHVEYLHDERGVGKLTLYANPRALDIIMKIIGGLVAGGAGAGFLYQGLQGINQRDANQAFFGLLAGALGAGFGVYAFFDGLHDCSIKSKKIPYITLDSECLLFWNGKRIWWCDVDHVGISSEQQTATTNYQWGNTGISTSHGKTITTRTLHLLDKFNSDLFKTPEHDCYLPITFDQFLGILEHYIAMYGGHRSH